ncbi:LysR family transcriptional regulator [Vibrio cyclitrophicus]|nr:LysR family transcriptional regulator [Vibrio cyclitrophicus]UPR54281.1 LysR family transcriptional regulator [Vibrio cyclitrophicus]
MNFKYLSTFISVAECSSFSQAAKQLHVVQSAISRHVSTLEAELGFVLFERSTRHVELTDAGRHFYNQVSTTYKQLEQAKTDSLMISNGKVGVLRIGYLSSVCSDFLPNVLRAFSSEYPDIEFDINDLTAAQQAFALEHGTIDIAFTRIPNSRQLNTFHRSHLIDDHIVAVVSKYHPLANASVLTLEQLNTQPLMLFNRQQAPNLFDSIISAFHQQQLQPDVKHQPQNMQSLLTQVASTHNVAIVPSSIRYLQSKDCVFIPIDQVISIALEMHWRKQSTPITDVWLDWFFVKGVALLRE